MAPCGVVIADYTIEQVTRLILRYQHLGQADEGRPRCSLPATIQSDSSRYPLMGADVAAGPAPAVGPAVHGDNPCTKYTGYSILVMLTS